MYRTGDRESREKLERAFQEISGEVDWVDDPDILLTVSKDREFSVRYRARYTVIVITEKSYYEIVYRFSSGKSNYTFSEMSFGRIRAVESGEVELPEEKTAMKNHAVAMVKSWERRAEGDPALNLA